MSAYHQAVTSIVCRREDGGGAVELDVAYGPLVTEEQRVENLLRAYQAMEPDLNHRKREVVYDREAQPRDHF